MRWKGSHLEHRATRVMYQHAHPQTHLGMWTHRTHNDRFDHGWPNYHRHHYYCPFFSYVCVLFAGRGQNVPPTERTAIGLNEPAWRIYIIYTVYMFLIHRECVYHRYVVRFATKLRGTPGPEARDKAIHRRHIERTITKNTARPYPLEREEPLLRVEPLYNLLSPRPWPYRRGSVRQGSGSPPLLAGRGVEGARQHLSRLALPTARLQATREQLRRAAPSAPLHRAKARRVAPFSTSSVFTSSCDAPGKAGKGGERGVVCRWTIAQGQPGHETVTSMGGRIITAAGKDPSVAGARSTQPCRCRAKKASFLPPSAPLCTADIPPRRGARPAIDIVPRPRQRRVSPGRIEDGWGLFMVQSRSTAPCWGKIIDDI